MSEPAALVTANLHASAMVRGEAGILVRGPSGSGKTRLVMALVETSLRDGRFARLVADDRTLVSAYGPRLVARPHPALAGRVERRGLGILAVDHEPACLLELVVDLASVAGPRLPEPEACEDVIAGVRLPRLALRAATPTADAVSLVLATLADADARHASPCAIFLAKPAAMHKIAPDSRSPASDESRRRHER